MILSDKTLRKMMFKGAIVIDPEPEDWQIQPASIDLTVGRGFMSPYNDIVVDQDYYLLGAGECLLGTTAQYIEVPDDMVARVEGKSSWGRKFLQVHATAGYIDPGFAGNVTLELTNLANVSHMITVGEAIAQISFEWVDQPVTRPYGSDGLNSHYQNQDGVTRSATPWR
jgi:dCTP deaminase